MTNKAIYAFSGDPITNGHINIITRAARVFDELYVAIGQNPEKQYMFSLAERKAMAVEVLQHIDNVTVVSFTGLLVDFAYEQGIKTIVKGVRNAADFEYEHALHQVGESQKLGVDTHILFADVNLSHVSSSMVKAVQREHGLIHDYVPLHIKQMLEQRISKQKIIGLTGEIAVGKTFICNALADLSKGKDFQVHHIEMDHLAHDILQKLNDPVHIETRKRIALKFGKEVLTKDQFINRKILGEKVFGSAENLKILNNIMRQPILLAIKRALYSKSGIILINAALLVEFGMTYLCNNNIVLVKSSKNSQNSRLQQRGLTELQIKKRLASQYSHDKKLINMQNIIARDNYGTILHVENNNNLDFQELYSRLVDFL